MLKRVIGAGACIALLAIATDAAAQVKATMVLRSGERLDGQLVDFSMRRGFTFRVGGQDRRVEKADVAVIDFVGDGSAEANDFVQEQLRNGKHVIELRSGERVSGNIFDIGRRNPLRIDFDTTSGQRPFDSDDVARIYLGTSRGGGGTPVTPADPAEPGAIVVPGNQQWVPTGLIVRRGETISLRSSGEIQLSANSNDKARPAGAMSGRRAPGSPLPEELAGALIARIGNDPPFALGNLNTSRMPAAGPLYLGVNDDAVGDNSGQFNVVITRPGRR
jgi:hypothetical protein